MVDAMLRDPIEYERGDVVRCKAYDETDGGNWLGVVTKAKFVGAMSSEASSPGTWVIDALMDSGLEFRFYANEIELVYPNGE